MLLSNRQIGSRILNACLHGGVKFADLLASSKGRFTIEVLPGRETLHDHSNLESGARSLYEGLIVKAHEHLKKHFERDEVIALLDGRAMIKTSEVKVEAEPVASTKASRNKKSVRMVAAA